MSEKVLDAHGRWRSLTVGFRVSPEEDEQIERLVALTGLTKQDYIIRRLTEQDVVVQGNPKVYAALRREIRNILSELQRLSNVQEMKDETLETLEMISRIMAGMKEADGNKG